jgi:glycosyltransferase involved in cell wall biosynthesis
MHILIIHQAFASLDEPGGTRHFEFARLLAARGYQVTVIASPVSYITGERAPFQPSRTTGEEQIGVNILRVPVYAAHHKSFLHRMLAFFSFMFSSFWVGLGVKNVDVVWGTSPPIFQGATAWALARLKGARFLFEVRDLWPQFAIAVGVLTNPILIGASQWLERFLYHHADRVLVNSPGFMTHVVAHGAQRVALVPNGADPAMFDPSSKGMEFRRANHLEGKFVALYAGAHGMSNDLEVVLEAARFLEGRNIQVVFVGDGKEKPALQRRAAGLGLKDTTFVPSLPKSEMPQALAAADACIAILKPLDEYKTTYPNKVFDYLAAGRPVILAIDGVIREVVEAAQCGLFVRPGDPQALADAICSLADNPQNSRRMGLNGRKYLEANFGREKVAEKLVRIFEELSSPKEP